MSQWFPGERVDALALADIDGDGDLDLLTAHTFPPEVHLAFNDGAGMFTPGPTLILVTGWASSIGVGDLDGDGDLDIAVASQTSPGPVLFFNDGLKFTRSEPLATASTARSIFVTDLGQDGVADIMTGNMEQPRISLWISDKMGGMLSETIVDFAGLGSGVSLADVDADGVIDLLAPSDPPASSLQILRGDAKGGFAGLDSLLVDTTVPVTQLLAADLVGDVTPELVAIAADSEGGLVHSWLAAGPASWNEPPFLVATTSPLDGGVLARIDGDDAPDLVSATGASTIAMLLGDGAGSFSCEQTLAIPGLSSPSNLAVGDLDGDARMELVAASSGEVTIFHVQ